MHRTSSLVPFLMLSFLAAPPMRADILVASPVAADLTGAAGATLTFMVMLSNPSPTDTVYLNGVTSSTVTTFLTVDNSPFFDNAPFSLSPGQNSGPTPFALFNIDIDPRTPVGDYFGNIFSILGGPDGGTSTDFSDLVDIPFNVTVESAESSVPEPNFKWAFLIILVAWRTISRFGRCRTVS